MVVPFFFFLSLIILLPQVIRKFVLGSKVSDDYSGLNIALWLISILTSILFQISDIMLLEAWAFVSNPLRLTRGLRCGMTRWDLGRPP